MNEYITRLIDITIALERQQCAHHYLALMRDAVEQARTKEREQCAKDYLEDCANAVEKARLEEREQCAKFFDANNDLLFWGSAAAKAIRERTEPKSEFKNQMDDNWAGLI
jgi:hypothetical protein